MEIQISNRPLALVVLVGLSMVFGALWLPGTIMSVISGPQVSYALYLFVTAVCVLAASVFVLKRRSWAAAVLVSAMALLCLNQALEYSFYRVSIVEILWLPQSYLFPLTLLLIWYLSRPQVRAHFISNRLSVRTTIVLIGTFFVGMGVVRVSRVLFPPQHAFWEEIGFLLTAIDVGLLVLGIVILLRKHTPQRVLLPVTILLVVVSLWRLASLLYFVLRGPMLLLMEGARGAMDLNELYVLVVAEIALLYIITRKEVAEVLFSNGQLPSKSDPV